MNINEIGLTIKEARNKQCITQAKLSELTGLSRTYIADIESGRNNPSLKTLIKIAKFIHLGLKFLNNVDVNTEIDSN